jgi:glycosyltransferase involved in cell wall biosynthesis
MSLLKSKDLLLIVPNFRDSLHDQATRIRSFLNDVHVLLPIPYFSNLALHIPYIERRFRFLRTMSESNDFSIIFPRYFTLPLKAIQRRNSYLAANSCMKAIARNSLNFDLINVHFLDNGLIGVLLKGLYNKPLVITAHGGDVYSWPFQDKWNNALASYVLAQADQVIATNHSDADTLSSLGVPSNRLHIIPNGYDDKLFYPVPSYEARKQLGLPLDEKILLSIGNLVDIKGHIYLINAMKTVSKVRKDILLIIVGSGILKEALQKTIETLGLGQNILLVGWKKHTEISTWINASDLFVLPSLGEGFPVVIPEVMACGKPVIATRVGGVPEAICSSEFGTLITPKDPAALSRAILEGLNRDWSTEKILDEAKKYSWRNIVNQIIAVYKSVFE